MARADLAQGFFLAQVFRGFAYPWRGLGFVYGKHPSLIRYTVFQVLLTVAVFAAVIVGWSASYDSIAGLLWSRPESAWLVWLWYLYRIVAALALAVVGYFVFIVLVGIVCAPFNSKLSQKVETLLTGRLPPSTGFADEVREAIRDIRVALGKVFFYAMVMLPVFLIGLLVPGLGQILLVVFGWLFTALYLSLDYLDWPLSRRRIGFGDRLSYLKRHRWPMLGFGAAAFLLLWIPVLSFFLVPAAVAGGTLLFVDLGDRVEN